MRRFLITSPTYNGEIDILYDAAGRLVKIDFMNTDMSAGMIQAAKGQIPVLVDSLAEAFAASKATVVESSYEVQFIDFWKAYDKKVNKKRCEPLWAKLSPTDRINALHGVQPYKKYLTSLPYKRAEADPEKYLRDRYWENDWK